MKIAIVGSRTITVDHLENLLPENVTEIVSGGAEGVDTCAAAFAEEKGLKLTVFLPQYEKFGRAAPLKRNEQIANYADCAIAFWDGKSKGTLHAVRQFEKHGKFVRVVNTPQKHKTSAE